MYVGIHINSSTTFDSFSKIGRPLGDENFINKIGKMLDRQF